MRHVYIPWLTASSSIAIKIALPRVFLAVLISEYMITGTGLGGMLWRQRGQRDYAEAWCTLLVVVICISLMFSLSEILARCGQQTRGVSET